MPRIVLLLLLLGLVVLGGDSLVGPAEAPAAVASPCLFTLDRGQVEAAMPEIWTLECHLRDGVGGAGHALSLKFAPFIGRSAGS